jgi:hypothetical protein
MKQYEAERGIESKSGFCDPELAVNRARERRKKVAEVKARVAAAG